MTDAPEWSVAVDCRNLLGEGPCWDAPTGTLVWVDISGRLVQRFDPTSGVLTERRLEQQVSAVVPRAAGGQALALEDGVWLTDADDGRLRRLVAIRDEPESRLNDAKCDPQGRLWVGSMAHDERPGAGALHRVGPDGALSTVLSGTTISNGMGWSPDGRRMYYIDSALHRIDVLEFDMASGRASGRRSLADLPEDWGLADGMTVDADGHLWVAFWDGWAIRRFTPDGTCERTIQLPVARVTSCAFGGRDLGDLYVTSSGADLPGGGVDQPLAGALFLVRPGVTGFAATPFAG